MLQLLVNADDSLGGIFSLLEQFIQIIEKHLLVVNRWRFISGLIAVQSKGNG